MPFASKAQQRFMFSQHPAIAKEFAAKTPSIKALPDRVNSKPAGIKRGFKKFDEVYSKKP